MCVPLKEKYCPSKISNQTDSIENHTQKKNQFLTYATQNSHQLRSQSRYHRQHFLYLLQRIYNHYRRQNHFQLHLLLLVLLFLLLLLQLIRQRLR